MQAARMGSVSTTLRRIGCRNAKYFSSSTSTGIDPEVVNKIKISATHKKKQTTALRRNNSSLASAVNDWTDDESSMNSPAAAFVLQQQQQKADPVSTKEAWMVNLGRNDDNAWLTGPRNEQEWFTGVPPSQCPGTLPMYETSRSCFVGSIGFVGFGSVNPSCPSTIACNSPIPHCCLCVCLCRHGLPRNHPLLTPPQSRGRHPRECARVL